MRFWKTSRKKNKNNPKTNTKATHTTGDITVEALQGEGRLVFGVNPALNQQTCNESATGRSQRTRKAIVYLDH